MAHSREANVPVNVGWLLQDCSQNLVGEVGDARPWIDQRERPPPCGVSRLVVNTRSAGPAGGPLARAMKR